MADQLHPKDFYSVRTWLASAMDEEGNDPALRFASSESRGPGKTFSATDVGLERHFADLEEKLGWVVRYHKMIGAATAQINKVLSVNYPGYWCRTKDLDKTLGEITLHWAETDADGEVSGTASRVLGYSLPLNLFDQIKSYSGLLSKMPTVVFDEYQIKDGKGYLPRETELLAQVLESTNRDERTAVRAHDVYMLSNTESIANPYYEAFGLSSRVRGDSKRVRGYRWVYEKARSAAVEAQRINSPLGQLLRRKEGVYDQGYNDNTTGVARPDKGWGDGEYIGTITLSGKSVGLRYYSKKDVLHVSRRVDFTHPAHYRGSADDDATLEAVKTSVAGNLLRQCWRDGTVRFDAVTTKAAVLNILY